MKRPALIREIATFNDIPVSGIDETLPLSALTMDSFALVELALHLQDECGVILEHDDFEGVASVGDLLDLFEKRMATV